MESSSNSQVINYQASSGIVFLHDDFDASSNPISLEEFEQKEVELENVIGNLKFDVGDYSISFYPKENVANNDIIPSKQDRFVAIQLNIFNGMWVEISESLILNLLSKAKLPFDLEDLNMRLRIGVFESLMSNQLDRLENFIRASNKIRSVNRIKIQNIRNNFSKKNLRKINIFVEEKSTGLIEKGHIWIDKSESENFKSICVSEKVAPDSFLKFPILTQMLVGKSLLTINDFKKLQVGDLIFFDSKSSESVNAKNVWISIGNFYWHAQITEDLGSAGGNVMINDDLKEFEMGGDAQGVSSSDNAQEDNKKGNLDIEEALNNFDKADAEDASADKIDGGNHKGDQDNAEEADIKKLDQDDSANEADKKDAPASLKSDLNEDKDKSAKSYGDQDKTAAEGTPKAKGAMQNTAYANTDPSKMEKAHLSRKPDLSSSGNNKSLDKINVELSFEIARNMIPFESVKNLSKGKILKFPNLKKPSVMICINTQKVGVGELVKVGGEIGIRVTNMG